MDNDSNPARRVLTEARRLLDDEQRWTQGVFVRHDIDGKPQCWCIGGAIAHAAGDPSDEPMSDVTGEGMAAVLLALGDDRGEDLPDADTWDNYIEAVAGFNDRPTTTHDLVLEVLDAAIEEVRHAR